MPILTGALLGSIVGSTAKLIATTLAGRQKTKMMKVETVLFQRETERLRLQLKHQALHDARQNQHELALADHAVQVKRLDMDQELQLSADDLQKEAIQADATMPIVQQNDSWLQKLRVSVRPVLSYYLVLVVSGLAIQYVWADSLSDAILTEVQFSALLLALIDSFSAVVGFVFGSRIIRD